MKTFLYDDSGDIDISQGVRLTPDDATYAVQRLEENLSEFLGEWFLDTRRGIPFFKHVMIKNPDMGLVESIFRRAITQSPLIKSVESFSVIRNKNRKFEIRFTARMVSGDIIGTEQNTPFIVGG